MAFMFENLDVYQKAVDFTDEITNLTAAFLRGYYFLSRSDQPRGPVDRHEFGRREWTVHEGRPQELLHHRSRLGPGVCTVT